MDAVETSARGLGPRCRALAGNRGRRLEWVVLVALVVVVTPVFWLTDLDLVAAKRFYDPDGSGSWPVADRAPWPQVYRLTPVIVAVPAIGALATMIMARRSKRRAHWYRPALFVFLSYLIGPGLLVNAVFKDHWGRPRPCNTVQFGGVREYLPPLLKSDPGREKSFPCGHASVGFAAAAFAVLAGRRRPRVAAAVMVVSTGLGTVIGYGRMAEGGHYLSDVIWAAVLSWAAVLLAERFVSVTLAERRTEPLQSAWSRISRRLEVAGYAALIAATLLAVLVATPVARNVAWAVDSTELDGRSFAVDIQADAADIDLEIVDTDGPVFVLEGHLTGFGLPQSKIVRHAEIIEAEPPVVRFRSAFHGVYSDTGGALRVRVAGSLVERLRVHVDAGDIAIRSQAPLDPARFQASTDAGTVAQELSDASLQLAGHPGSRAVEAGSDHSP